MEPTTPIYCCPDCHIIIGYGGRKITDSMPDFTVDKYHQAKVVLDSHGAVTRKRHFGRKMTPKSSLRQLEEAQKTAKAAEFLSYTARAEAIAAGIAYAYHCDIQKVKNGADTTVDQADANHYVVATSRAQARKETALMKLKKDLIAKKKIDKKLKEIREAKELFEDDDDEDDHDGELVARTAGLNLGAPAVAPMAVAPPMMAPMAAAAPMSAAAAPPPMMAAPMAAPMMAPPMSAAAAIAVAMEVEAEYPLQLPNVPQRDDFEARLAALKSSNYGDMRISQALRA